MIRQKVDLKQLARQTVGLTDVFLVVFVIPAALLLKLVRRLGLARLPLTRSILLRFGVLPVRHHYYEPFVSPSELTADLAAKRCLPGIDLNENGQLQFLSSLSFEDELRDFGAPGAQPMQFAFGTGSFESGDAEYLYQVIRRTKPARLFEIGSGQSTLIARAAIAKNQEEDRYYSCRHVCVEPYEAPFLESLGIEVLRQRVQDLDLNLFLQLESNDILFIDSSHVIRPQGDVLFEYLELLPMLRSGVIVHVHDVFTPRDYLREWVVDSLMLWNEQYLLEAFLSENKEWTILGAVNFLAHNHFSALKRACPFLTAEREPGSFYFQKK